MGKFQTHFFRTSAFCRTGRALIVGAGLAASAFIAPAVGGENWNLTNEYGTTSIHVEGNQVFADALAKATNGEITVTIHPGGSLGYKSVDHFDAVGDGAVDIADTPGGFLGGIDPLMQLSSLPFLIKSVEEARVLLDAAYDDYSKMFEENGQKLLYVSPWPASGIWAQKAVTSVDDMKDLKIRTFDPGGTKTFAAVGASPIQLAWGDVVPQLATGGINSVLTSAEGGVGQKFVEHTAYFTEINYALPLNFVHMNKELFDGLSDAQQKAVMDAAAAASERNWTEVAGRTATNYEAIKAAGGTVVTEGTDDLLADMSKAAAFTLEEWLDKTGERGAAIIETFRKRTSGS